MNKLHISGWPQFYFLKGPPKCDLFFYFCLFLQDIKFRSGFNTKNQTCKFYILSPDNQEWEKSEESWELSGNGVLHKGQIQY